MRVSTPKSLDIDGPSRYQVNVALYNGLHCCLSAVDPDIDSRDGVVPFAHSLPRLPTGYNRTGEPLS